MDGPHRARQYPLARNRRGKIISIYIHIYVYICIYIYIYIYISIFTRPKRDQQVCMADNVNQIWAGFGG